MHRMMVMGLWVGLTLTSLAVEKLSSGLLAKGTKWETPIFQRDSGATGPTVFITGGVHGNEPAGARAAEQIRHWPIKKGRIIIIPRVNNPGLLAKTRFLPGERRGRYDQAFESKRFFDWLISC